ncbi:MAG: glycoside hydrolase family 3 N-terminal domain-containing protein, partial [Nanoarchaeota archaeon]
MSRSDNLLSIFLFILTAVLLTLNVLFHMPLAFESSSNIQYVPASKTVILESLTLKQKIAQMVIAYGNEETIKPFQRMAVGGIHLAALPSYDDYTDRINDYQQDAPLPMFITVDLEGCINAMENLHPFPTFREIPGPEQAYSLGKEMGNLISGLGFTVNFAPVTELDDTIWGCRTFPGTPEEIADMANAFIDGIHEEGILVTAKHYPGKTLIAQDPHEHLNRAIITEEDLVPFQLVLDEGIDMVMVT